jgi:hypothetical protein
MALLLTPPAAFPFFTTSNLAVAQVYARIHCPEFDPADKSIVLKMHYYQSQEAAKGFPQSEPLDLRGLPAEIRCENGWALLAATRDRSAFAVAYEQARAALVALLAPESTVVNVL